MEQERKNKTKAIMVIALAVCLVSIAVTAAYFIVNTRANNQELTVTTGTMALTFNDNSDGINQALMFGESVTKDFKIENTGTLPAVAKISFDDLVNTYIAESLTYTLSYATSETGTYNTVKSANVPRSDDSSKVELAGNLTIPAGETYYYRLTIKLEYLEDIDQTEDLNASFSTRFTIDEDKVGEDTYTVNVSGLTLEVNRKRPDFASIATTDEGIYAMQDDYGTSYYYRGAVENNYVKFGKWNQDLYFGYASTESTAYQTYNSLEECESASSYNFNCSIGIAKGTDMYWRIIRVNGDGSVRLIYDGTQVYENGVSDTARSAFTTAWNTNNNDAKYVGYMYGGDNGVASTSKEQAQTNETSTNIKTQLEEWYKTNLKDNYGQYIADVIFCNDRSTADTPNIWYTEDTTLGYETNITVYGAYGRLRNPSGSGWKKSASPTFVCPQDNDKFTVESTISGGNTALNEPVGLITLDEAAAAGGRWAGTDGSSNNSNYYLYKGHWYYSLSPNGFYGSHASVFAVYTDGDLNGVHIFRTYGAVAPVINLSAETVTTLVGTGEISNPYRLSET